MADKVLAENLLPKITQWTVTKKQLRFLPELFRCESEFGSRLHLVLIFIEKGSFELVNRFVELGNIGGSGVCDFMLQVVDAIRAVHTAIDVALKDRLPGQVVLPLFIPGGGVADSPVARVPLDTEVASHFTPGVTQDGIVFFNLEREVVAGDAAGRLFFEKLLLKLHPKVIDAVALDIDLVFDVFAGFGVGLGGGFPVTGKPMILIHALFSYNPKIGGTIRKIGEETQVLVFRPTAIPPQQMYFNRAITKFKWHLEIFANSSSLPAPAARRRR
jgi:hypothetical protein